MIATMGSYVAGPAESVSEVTIDELLARAAQAWPERAGLIERGRGRRLTWRELDATVTRVAAALQANGLVPGARVGVWTTNCVEWVFLQFACARAGLVLVNINPAYRSHELSFVLRKSGIQALFLQERDARADYREILAASMAGQDLALKDILFLSDWNEFESKGSEFRPVSLVPEDVANIQYTSGTTVQPKGVLLTHRNLVNNGRFIAGRLKATEADRICLPVPLYHCFGCVIGTLVAAASGAATILPAPQFDPLATLQAIHEERATAVYGVPTMFIAMLHHPRFAEFDLTSLRTGVMAGAPCPIEVMRRVVVDMHCREITIAYGQTESSPVITMSSADDSVELRCSTVGRALPATEVKIVCPETGALRATGEQGELCTRGYLVMKGYDEEPEATKHAIDDEGWLHTGDLAVLRNDGYFRITGRAKDTIIRGGENIYPREVEEYLHLHPLIAEVYVVGLPDELLGEVVAAWVRLKPGALTTADEIRGFCQGKIAYFKIPQLIRFVDSFPTTANGKIQKYKMREFEIHSRHLERAAQVATA